MVNAIKLGLLPLVLAGCATAAIPDGTGHGIAETTSGVANESPTVGAPAPSFVAPATDGSNVALASFRGRTVVLWFFGKAGSPSATREAEGFRDVAAALKVRGVIVVGVSTDPLEEQEAFARELGLDYPLVSDSSGSIARVYGVPMTYGLAERRTFVIGPSGTVEAVYRDVDPATHPADVAKRVARLRSS